MDKRVYSNETSITASPGPHMHPVTVSQVECLFCVLVAQALVEPRVALAS